MSEEVKEAMEATKVKYIDIKEFRERGYLQELNRQFLHPLGLALAVRCEEDGTESLQGIWDYRDDPEGMCYTEEVLDSDEARRKKILVEEERKTKGLTRIEKLGYTIQPIPGAE